MDTLVRLFQNPHSLARNLVLPFYKKSTRQMVEQITPYLQQKDRVLDLGCGTGLLAHMLEQEADVRVVGIDVRNTPRLPIEFVQYDGSRVPFADDSCDVVLIAYVLHHVGDVRAMLREAKRVARRSIIVYEDTPASFMDKIFCQIHGITYNSILALESSCTFYSEKDWEEIFAELGLSLFQKRELDMFNPIYRTRRSCFVLEAGS